ncbi:hypothetical protein FOZ63_001069, partial [Perkinsus olseni]
SAIARQLSYLSERFARIQAEADARTPEAEERQRQGRALGEAAGLISNCTCREIVFQVDNLAERLASGSSIFRSRACTLAGMPGWRIVVVVECCLEAARGIPSEVQHPLPGMIGVEIEGPREVSSFSCYVCIGKDKRVRVENHNFMPDDGRMGAPVRLRGICSLQEAYERPSDCLTVGVELESSRAPWTLHEAGGLASDGITAGVREVLQPSISQSKGREILRCLEVLRNRMVKSARWVIHNAREVLALGRPAVTSQRFTIAGVEQVEIEIAVSEGKKWEQPVLGVKLSCTGVISLKVGVKVGRTPQKILGASLDAAEVSKSIRKAVDLPALTIAKSNLCPLLDGGALDHSENTATVVLTVLSARLASRQLAPGVTVHEECEGEWRCEVPAFVPPTSPGGIMTCVDLPRVPDRSPAEELLVSRGMARGSANELENSPSEETRYSRPCHTAIPRVHR